MSSSITISANASGQGGKTFKVGSLELSSEIHGTVRLGIKNGYRVLYWANLSYSQAHELACVLFHLLGHELKCDGSGKVEAKADAHDMSVAVRINLYTDLCTLLNDPEKVGKEMQDKLGAEFKNIMLPKKGGLIHD